MTVGSAINSLFVPLTHLPYRRLFIAQVFSDFGNFFDFVALEALIVYEWGLGAGALAAFAFALAAGRPGFNSTAIASKG